MRGMVLMVVLIAMVGAMLSGCATASSEWASFNPASATAEQTASILARVDKDARLGASVAVAVLKPDDVAKVRSVLTDLRAYVVAKTRDSVSLLAVAKPLIAKFVADPDRQRAYTAVVCAALSAASCLIPESPPGGTAATIAAYAAFGQQAMLTAFDAVLATLPPDAPGEKGGSQ